MSGQHTIEVDEEVFRLLKKAAEPFVDTPNTLLRRLLGVGANFGQPRLNLCRHKPPIQQLDALLFQVACRLSGGEFLR